MANNDLLSNSIPFFISGSEKPQDSGLQPSGGIKFGLGSESNIPLFTSGVTGSPNSNVNLFIEGTTPPSSTNSVTLTIRGSTAGYKYGFKALNLFIEGAPLGAKLNMFIHGSDIFRPQEASLNLFVGGVGNQMSKAVDLVIWGSTANYSLSLNSLTIEQLIQLTIEELYSLPLDSTDIFTGYYTSRGLDLYIRGEGEFDDFLVYSTWMNLYLQGGTGSTRTLDLFMQGSPYSGQSLDLYSHGVTGVTSNSIPLYMFSEEIVTQKLNLFTRGYR